MIMAAADDSSLPGNHGADRHIGMFQRTTLGDGVSHHRFVRAELIFHFH